MLVVWSGFKLSLRWTRSLIVNVERIGRMFHLFFLKHEYCSRWNVSIRRFDRNAWVRDPWAGGGSARSWDEGAIEGFLKKTLMEWTFPCCTERFGVDLFIDVAVDGFQMAFGANAVFVVGCWRTAVLLKQEQGRKDKQRSKFSHAITLSYIKREDWRSGRRAAKWTP